MTEENINTSALRRETQILPNSVIMKEIVLQIAEGRSVELMCRGNSMNPFLVDRRDSLVLSPFDPNELKVGDVVLSRLSSGHFVVHRIASITPQVSRHGIGAESVGTFGSESSRHGVGTSGSEPLVIQLNGDGNSASSRETVAEVIALMSGYVRKGKKGSVEDAKWLRYSRFWAFCSRVGVGSWTLRRVILGFFHRFRRMVAR